MEQLIRIHIIQDKTIYHCPFQGTCRFSVPGTHYHKYPLAILSFKLYG